MYRNFNIKCLLRMTKERMAAKKQRLLFDTFRVKVSMEYYSFQILTLSDSRTSRVLKILTISDSDTFRILKVLTLSDSDTFRF